jgi:5,5'-dehydrodivanillate O-demethylase
MTQPAATAGAERRPGLEDIVRTGPGTLAGRYLRSFWQPVYHSVDLAVGRAKPLRVLGESFTLYRGASGTPHLVDRACPHRGMRLFAGKVEGDAIRCFYHGWKFDAGGQCVEQPVEESRFAAKMRIRSYPVREYLGFIFAFLGEGAPPEFPLYPEFEHFDGLLETDSYLRDCSFFQNLENLLDQSHIGYVHGATAASFGEVRGRGLKAEESEWGITYTYARDDGQKFVVQFGMPNIGYLVTLPTDPEIGWQETLEWWVPVDDVSHVQFSVHRVPATGEAARRIHERREARRHQIDRAHQRVADEILSGRLTMDEVDPARCDMVRLQDDVAQGGQGRIADRSLEHPGSGDVGLVMGRRLWRRELAVFADGGATTAWKRPPDMRPVVWGLSTAPAANAAAGLNATPLLIDMRPFVEIDEQMKAFGAQLP